MEKVITYGRLYEAYSRVRKDIQALITLSEAMEADTTLSEAQVTSINNVKNVAYTAASQLTDTIRQPYKFRLIDRYNGADEIIAMGDSLIEMDNFARLYTQEKTDLCKVYLETWYNSENRYI